VNPDTRGRGLGRRIVGRLVARARRDGATMVWVNARFTAVGFWHRLGFKDAGSFDNAEGTHLPHKRLEMRLT
jgi:GNAT superfamily N-acetyltransferase